MSSRLSTQHTEQRYLVSIANLFHVEN